MRTIPQTSRPGERGYVLVAALVTLLLLTVLGIWASRTTNVEIVTANNERTHKETFYQADAGAHLAERLIYHNDQCGGKFEDEDLLPASLIFYTYELSSTEEIRPLDDKDYNPAKDEPEDGTYTFQHYPDPKDRDRDEDERLKRPHTNVLVGSKQEDIIGWGLNQSSCYDGLCAGGGEGVPYRYRIRSQHKGHSDSEYKVEVEWRLLRNPTLARPGENCHYKKGSDDE